MTTRRSFANPADVLELKRLDRRLHDRNAAARCFEPRGRHLGRFAQRRFGVAGRTKPEAGQERERGDACGGGDAAAVAEHELGGLFLFRFGLGRFADLSFGGGVNTRSWVSRVCSRTKAANASGIAERPPPSLTRAAMRC
jgi:hypothetical protein